MEQEKIIRMVSVFLTFVCAVSANFAHAKSVYAITDHEKSTLRAYEIQGDQLEYQADVEVTDYEDGAVDVTVDSRLELLFITYEISTKIVWADAKTMEQKGFIDLRDVYPSADQLAGVVADEGKQLVYTVERADNKLYILGWDTEEAKLELRDPDDTSQPYSAGDPYITLVDLGGEGAYGLALDGNRLYVSNNTTSVHYYNTDSWAHLGTRDVGRNAADLAIDPNNGEHNAYLYIGALYDGWQNFGHPFLVKHDLEADVNPNTESNIGTVPIGIAADPNSGLVYVGTSDREIRIYDCSEPTFVCTYWVDTGGQSGPAGIAVGSRYKPAPPGLRFDKTAEIENGNTCVSPVDENKDEITYEISYWNKEEDENEPNYLGTLDVVITDWLSNDVNFVSADPCDTGYYDPNKHAYILDITLEPGDKGTLTLIVQVREWADPRGTIANFVEIESEKYYKTATTATGVCCFGGDIIYVDWRRGDPNNGTSWELAYSELQDALARSAKGCGDEIWVAGGVYKATTPFDMVDDVEVYGGFAGDETIRDDRDYAVNKTYLTGDLDSDGDADSDNVITARDTVSSTAELDGFIITKSIQAGIRCDGADPAIIHCAIVDNENDGVYCANADPSINNCVIMDNGGDGIELAGSSSPSAIKNCWICRNGTGISFGNPDSATTVRNNTIADNANVGVYQHAGTYADISNCIIWGNEGGQLDFDDEHMPTYSCIQDSNEVNPYHNINSNPDFAYTDPNLADYHLHPDSPCVDAGDPCDTYNGEKDIDGDDRVLNGDDYSPDNGRVDMGADEVACDDIYNSLDWNIDAIVDVDDLIVLAAAWLSDPCDPCDDNWNRDCDIQPETGDGDVDYGDFAVFGNEWLWEPCWTTSGPSAPMMMGMGGGMDGLAGGESMLISAPATEQISKTPSEPSIEEQIEQIKQSIDFLYEIKDQVEDKDACLGIVNSLEEMLKELEDSQ